MRLIAAPHLAFLAELVKRHLPACRERHVIMTDYVIKVYAFERNGLLIIPRCPFCAERHWHGAAGGFGLRAAHCVPGWHKRRWVLPSQSYELVADKALAEPPPPPPDRPSPREARAIAARAERQRQLMWQQQAREWAHAL